MKREFPIETVLSITTGRLVTPIEKVYEILNFLTRDNLFTHQLPRAGRECAPWLLRWFPGLENVETWQLDQFIEEWKQTHDVPLKPADEPIRLWVDVQALKHELPRTFELGPIPQDDHERKDAYDELVVMRGTDQGIVLVGVPDEDPPIAQEPPNA